MSKQFLEILAAADLQPDDIEFMTMPTATGPGRARLVRAQMGEALPDAPRSKPLISRSGAKLGFVAEADLLAPPYTNTYWLEQKPEFPVNSYWVEYSSGYSGLQLLCDDCLNKTDLPATLRAPGGPRNRCRNCKTINMEPYSYAALPLQVEDAWKHVGPEPEDYEPDLPAQHTAADFEQAADRVTTDCKTYGNGVDFSYLLPEQELLRVWQYYAEQNGHYIRPDLLAAAVSQVFAMKIDELADELCHYILEDWSRDFDNKVKKLTRKLNAQESL